MNQDEETTLAAIRKIFSEPPHQITKLGGAMAVMKVDQGGHSYFDPTFVDGMCRQGYDPTPVLQEMERTLREAGRWREGWPKR